MSLRSLPGPVSGSPRSLTIGSGGWPLITTSRPELVFGWSFYRQGTRGDTSSADEFLDAALTWFGDPDRRLGTAWEKGERLAKLITHRRTLLILDGLEPLQNPPGPQEG